MTSLQQNLKGQEGREANKAKVDRISARHWYPDGATQAPLGREVNKAKVDRSLPGTSAQMVPHNATSGSIFRRNSLGGVLGTDRKDDLIGTLVDLEPKSDTRD